VTNSPYIGVEGIVTKIAIDIYMDGAEYQLHDHQNIWRLKPAFPPVASVLASAAGRRERIFVIGTLQNTEFGSGYILVKEAAPAVEVDAALSEHGIPWPWGR
jgi:hypothetical protein